MSSYNELLKYSIHLDIDLTMFPTVWDVLSILLDTQDGNLEYVKILQEEYNRYYKSKSRKYMENLEKKSIEIQYCMHGSITQILIGFLSLYRENKMNSQKLLIVQKMPLKMMQLTY